MNLHLLDHIEDLEHYVSGLNSSEKLSVLKYLQACEDYKKTNKIKYFEPDDWQVQAMNLGSTERHRMVCAGNR